MTTGSIFWAVVFAGAGGVFVFVGLLMELETGWHKNLVAFRRYKARKFCGEWLVIIGIVIEIFVAVLSAIDAWQNEPLNRPVSDISAIVEIRVKGRDNVELPPWKVGSPSVADIILCREIVSFTNVLKIGLFFEPTNDWEIHDPSGLPNREPIPVPGFPILKADKFEVTQSSQFIGPPQPHDFHEYDMLFHPDLHSVAFNFGAIKVKDISKIKVLQIGLKFLPHDSEILQGTVVITVNDTHKIFYIQPQKDSCPVPDAPGIFNSFELVTTNIVQLQ
ncbi:MAG TPA: hypothetical protein VHY30_06330 [Verrucomicrobiae bacterium]|jgi:hypothetical protein|nr:hypothetical protein [Verrucomicrobiae bacterium]